MPESAVSRARNWWVLTLTCLVAAAVIATVVYDVMRRAGRMRAATGSADAVLPAQPGAVVKAVVRLESPPRDDLYTAELLESIDGTSYRETARRVQVAVTAATQVVMGSGADVRPGAVVQVAGTTDRKHTIRALRIVILTGYVRIAG